MPATLRRPAPAMPALRPVAEAGRLAAFFRPGPPAPAGQRRLLVSLAPRQETQAVWGLEFLGRFEAGLLGLADAGAGWYPQGDMAALLPKLRPILAAHDRVVLYGFSMGAYAALKYSGALGADVVLAFAPQASVEPGLVGGFDARRPACFYQPRLHDGMAVTASDIGGLALAFHDPALPDDAGHAALLAATGRVAAVATPFTGHEPVRFAKSTGLVERLLQAALDGTLTAGAARRWRRQDRARCPHYWLALTQDGLPRGRAAALLPRLERVQHGARRPAPLQLARLLALLETGAEAEAQAALQRFAPAPRATVEERVALWKAAAGLGLPPPDGAEPPPRPPLDAAWRQVIDFLEPRLAPRDRVLAPLPFWTYFGGCALSERPRPGPLPGWAVLHKGGLHPRQGDFLRALTRQARPVFGNDVFAVFRTAGTEPAMPRDRHRRDLERRLRQATGEAAWRGRLAAAWQRIAG
ncbi:hypothetical protein BKE38_10245 [Pseudoroseomonas deserti]|uniref:Alpha/beta hydrolase n=1 Tax=Teichococcus deserti TaxID=1817963 RepID=A0A1V2H3Y5_9PROT|nr:hypothetical protein [Pseudoroseomonas deserti]ONG54420.1 hypothetical protein BKE38_10245 [Pseudoroseomonas deserti]